MTNHRKPIKITFDATAMLVERTGVAYYTERLVTHLAQQYPDDIQLTGFYYNFLGRRDSSHLPRFKNLRYTRASIIPSKIVYQLRRWGIEFPIEILSLTRSDFILYPNFLSYPSLRGTPSAPVIHDLTYIDLPEYVSAKLRSDLVRFVPKAIKRSAFVVTVSEFSKRGLEHNYHVPANDILVTPIPPPPPAPVPAGERYKVLKKYGIDKPYILFVGTIEPRKNIPGLIDAYLRLPKDIRDAHTLVIVGRIGWNCETEVAQLEAAAKNGHDVIHLGYVTDRAKDILYQNAALFVTASQYEGFGMPILEAMSYGTPCAISDIPVFKEIAGDAAAYFDCHDSNDIARTIQYQLTHPDEAERLGLAGQAHADSYSWEKVAASVYEKIKAALDQQA
ncbi:MAG TPA: glycosyltransferase family 1 protein [Patescibacteria group bacterium]|nr:glycosyltransferase family 1 protein [Patescibacteria group bacterium]